MRERSSGAADDLGRVGTELSLAIGQLRRRLRAEAMAGEMSLAAVAALARLDQQGWLTTAELARSESMKPQSMGSTLARLEREGLVARRPHPTDGRQIQFGLTPQGTAARRQRGLAKREWLLAALARLDPDERATLAAATTLLRRLGNS